LTCPLFEVEPVAWAAPEAGGYDALLLTSANAVRLGGEQLTGLKALPVHAVGRATADAARAAGFEVATVGDGNAADLLARLPPDARLLHLAGGDHRDSDDPRVSRRIIYRAAEIRQPALPALSGLVVAVHSPSDAAAATAGAGWERVELAERPDDSSLLALAAMLCHTSPPT
jgi:uroporphyrinogen-III synthase